MYTYTHDTGYIRSHVLLFDVHLINLTRLCHYLSWGVSNVCQTSDFIREWTQVVTETVLHRQVEDQYLMKINFGNVAASTGITNSYKLKDKAFTP